MISLSLESGLRLTINGQPAPADHPMAALVEVNDIAIRRALRRNLRVDATKSEIVGRWHENGEEPAFEPYLVRTEFSGKPAVLNKYRHRIFPMDGYSSSGDFKLMVGSDLPGAKVKAVLETSTEMRIHYDELPKSMFSFMPVGIVWSPPKKSGYPVLVEYAVGESKRGELRRNKAAA